MGWNPVTGARWGSGVAVAVVQLRPDKIPLPHVTSLKLAIDRPRRRPIALSTSSDGFPTLVLHSTTSRASYSLPLTPHLTPEMASLQLRAQRTALRSLRTSHITAGPRSSRLHASLRCYATDIEPERPKAPRQGGNETKVGRTFQGQVMGSIGARLRREREQREQYEQWRNMTDPSRNWMVTFGE